MNYTNTKYLLDKRPLGMPEDDCWVIDKEFISSIANGEILIKVEYLSIDPYMRGRVNDGVSYASPVKIGELMVGETVGTVIESKSKLFGVGEKVCAHCGWQTSVSYTHLTLPTKA